MHNKILVTLALALLCACTHSTRTTGTPPPAELPPSSPLLAQIGAGWMAHMVCSGVFVSGRSKDHILEVEFGPGSDPMLDAYTAIVDRRNNNVRVKAPGYPTAIAVFREGLGCTLALGEPMESLQAVTIPPRVITARDDQFWPQGELVYQSASEVDYESLAAVLRSAVAHSDGMNGRGTRGVAVVYKGRLIGEAYAPGYSPDMPLYGASMTKTVNAMLIGRLVQAGKLSVDQSHLRDEWNGDGDPRADITLHQLLKAVSGLEFVENYDGDADVNVMLFTQQDMAAFAASKPLAFEPGTHWSYSSGTANIISAIARDTFEGDDESWLRFPDEALFKPLGLRTAVFETDTSGTFIGSSFLWANPRDFARLGLLLLQDGMWEGERLLPEGWVDYMATPHKGNQQLNYGAQTWLKGATDASGPAPIFYMSGFGGQTVWIDPENKLVIVRMGWDFDTPPWQMEAFAGRVLDAIVTPASP